MSIPLLLKKITTSFPILVAFAAALALIYPPLFTWFRGSLITFGLGGIMLSMGLTLQWDEFKAVGKVPKWALLGLILQFSIMPFLGWSLGYVFQLPPYFAVGLILVSCCPGGTASNVIAYLANAHVALSVSMTALSTLLAIIATPLLTSSLSGNTVAVDAMGLFMSTVKVVLLPVSLGVVLNRFFPKATLKVTPFAPPSAVLLITLIVASIIGQGKSIILSSGLQLVLALMVLHLLGFIFGFLLCYAFFKNIKVAKTIAIEVGMQNSGLGVVLARENFSQAAVAIPAAISSLIHSLYGSLFVALFKEK